VSAPSFRRAGTLPPKPDRARMGRQGEAMTGPHDRHIEGTAAGRGGGRGFGTGVRKQRHLDVKPGGIAI